MSNHSGRRIVIALDMHSATESGLSTLIDIARRLNASVSGLYIEDQQLLSAAGLPFSTEVNYLSAEEKSLDLEELERINKLSSTRARRLLEELTERDKLTWTFAVERGDVALRVMSDRGCDIYFPARVRQRLTIEHAVSRPAQQLVMIYRDRETFERILEVAKALSSNGAISDITIVSETPLPAEVAEKLPVQGVRVHFQLASSSNAISLNRLKLPGSSLVLMAKEGVESLTERQLSELLEQLPYPMMLID